MSFKQFCSKQGFFTKNSDEATHLFMDGGKLNIPLEKYPLFLKSYHKAIVSQEPVSLVEKVGRNCEMRFFLDIDKCVEITEILDVSKSVLKCDDYVIYQCTNNKGIHIIFNIIVNYSQAINYAKDIVSKLPKDIGVHVDESVYNTGLRMVGSIKFSSGKVDQRYYLPLGCKNIEDLTLNHLKKSIIRLRRLENYVQSKRVNNETLTKVADHIHKIHKNYSDIKLTTCKKIGDYYCINADSKFCCNIEKDHKSCGIYFVLSANNELYQKCFCPCKKLCDRKYGYCCDFKSKKIKIPSNVYKSLSNPKS